MKQRIVGIDYSLTSPSVCIGSDTEYKNCQIYYLTDLKKCQGIFGNLNGSPHSLWSCDEERYHNISQWVLKLLKKNDIVYLEGYSMGSTTGRLFNIAENTGVLKNLLWSVDYKVDSIPPTVVKKFATGKGNANKEKMQEAFFSETGINIKGILNLTEKQWNPSSDVIDSFYIMKKGFELESLK